MLVALSPEKLPRTIRFVDDIHIMLTADRLGVISHSVYNCKIAFHFPQIGLVILDIALWWINIPPWLYSMSIVLLDESSYIEITIDVSVLKVNGKSSIVELAGKINGMM